MLALSHNCRYFLYRSPTDMRFGIYSLAGLVRNELGFDPSSGDVFVFLGKRLNQIRLLQWDRDGFAMYGLDSKIVHKVPSPLLESPNITFL